MVAFRAEFNEQTLQDHAWVYRSIQSIQRFRDLMVRRLRRRFGIRNYEELPLPDSSYRLIYNLALSDGIDEDPVRLNLLIWLLRAQRKRLGWRLKKQDQQATEAAGPPPDPEEDV